ncbi:MAG TPA: hypothetical protein VN694_03590 [Caulobacteraceae bacterium]|nr:hypothetical protein [Caulobacteraceae bacterium]
MIKLAILAVAALAAGPLAAQAQDRDGYRTDGAHARPASGHGYDASARAYDHRYVRHGGTAYRSDYRGRLYGGGYGYADGGRYGGNVTFGVGYGGYYPYGGDYDAGAYPVGGYGADYAYSYPDQYGAYQPFAYGYSPPDDAYYAGGQGYDEDDDGYADGPAPTVGWSAGGPPADCGRWIWRADRGAYQWAPAAC